MGSGGRRRAGRRRHRRKPSGPWGEPPKRKRAGPSAPRQVTSLDDFLRRSRERFGGDGGGFSGGPSGKLDQMGRSLGLVLLWLLFTSFHVDCAR